MNDDRPSAEIRHIEALRAHRTDNASKLTPLQTLEDFAEDIRQGKEKPTKLMIIHLNNDDDKYTSGFRSCNMKASELLALLEVAKAKVLDWMRIV